MYKLIDQDIYKQAKAQDDRIAGWLQSVQDAEAKDEVIAKDMDLGRMHPNDEERCGDQGKLEEQDEMAGQDGRQLGL